MSDTATATPTGLHVNERVLLTQNGNHRTLQRVQSAVVAPQRGEVLIQVMAAGVSWRDVLMRRGAYSHTPNLPFVPGCGVVGTVVQTGQDVTSLRLGEQVAAQVVSGGYSRYLRVPVWRCVSLPDGSDPAEAVTLVLDYLAAYQMLHQVAGVMLGERVLIHDADNDIGTALAQLAKQADLQVYATAPTDKHEQVRHNGAVPIDDAVEDFVERVLTLTGDGVDVVVEAAGGDRWLRSYRALRLGGTLLTHAVPAPANGDNHRPFAPLRALKHTPLLFVPDGRRVVHYSAIQDANANRAAYRNDLSHLLQLHANGTIEPEVAQRVPLQAIDEAYHLLETGGLRGKLVLTVDEGDS